MNPPNDMVSEENHPEVEDILAVVLRDIHALKVHQDDLDPLHTRLEVVPCRLHRSQEVVVVERSQNIRPNLQHSYVG